jgi:hypothetical protein
MPPRRGGDEVSLIVNAIVGIIVVLMMVIIFAGTIFPALGTATHQDTSFYSTLLYVVGGILIVLTILSVWGRYQ